MKNAMPMVCWIKLRNIKEAVMDYLRCIDYWLHHSMERNQECHIRDTTDTVLVSFPHLNRFIFLFPTHHPSLYVGFIWSNHCPLFELVWDETQERA